VLDALEIGDDGKLVREESWGCVAADWCHSEKDCALGEAVFDVSDVSGDSRQDGATASEVFGETKAKNSPEVLEEVGGRLRRRSRRAKGGEARERCFRGRTMAEIAAGWIRGGCRRR